MTDADKEAAEAAQQESAKQEAVRQKPNVAEDRMTPPTDTTASDNWKTDNESFRRLAHTGEFAPPPAEESPEPSQSAEDQADRSTRNRE
jgi:hypothetical protein